MSNEEKSSLKVEGLGENKVPEVAGMNQSAQPAASVEQTVDVTAAPTVTAAPAKAQSAKVDVTSMPQASGKGFDTSKFLGYLKIAGIVFAALAVLVVIISLVSGKKVVCTSSFESKGVEQKITTILKFDRDGDLKTIKGSGYVDFSKSEDAKKLSKSELEDAAKSMLNVSGYDNLKVKVSGKKVKVSFELSSKELEALKEFTYGKLTDGKAKGSDTFYASSYGTCTIK